MTIFPATYTGPTVHEIGEDEVIRIIAAAAPSPLTGDDAAVLPTPNPNTRTVITTDALIMDRHFSLAWSTANEVGRKAVVQNLADIEAMGATPTSVVLSLSMPAHTPVSFVQELAEGIEMEASHWSIDLVGGDVTLAPIVVVGLSATGSLTGPVPPTTLGGAHPEQKVVACGYLGYSAAGLALLQHCGSRLHVPEKFSELVKAHLVPHVEPGRGMVARATGATAMTDNSDGLLQDLGRLAKASRVRIDIEKNLVAPDDLLLSAAEFLGKDPWEWVFSGGEDHTLVATTFTENTSGFRTIGSVSQHDRNGAVTIDGQIAETGCGWQSV